MTPEAPRTTKRPRLARILFGWLILACLALAGAWALRARLAEPRAKPLHTLGTLPDFALVSEDGKPFTKKDLVSRVTVVDFIFTRCRSSCPRLTARMQTLAAKVERESKRRGRPLPITLLSISVDPDNDTPDVLLSHARGLGVDLALWRWLTGPSEDVRRIVVDGFRVATERVEKGASEYDVLHGNWFVVLDQNVDIRGYFDVENPADVDTLWVSILPLLGAP